MDDFIKPEGNPEEAIGAFNQLQTVFSQYGFELKEGISNNNEATPAIPEDLKLISKTKQMEPNTEGLPAEVSKKMFKHTEEDFITSILII